MTWVDKCPCYRALLSVSAMILYIVGFATNYWVTADDGHYWGLWNRCGPSVTDSLGKNNSCLSIAPGDSPGYYEAVRFFACIALVNFTVFLQAAHCDGKAEQAQSGLREGKKPTLLTITGVCFYLIVAGVLGGCYKKDERWKDKNPALGYSFYLPMCASVLCVILAVLTWIYFEIKEKPFRTIDVASLPRRDSNVSTKSLTKGKKITIFRSELYSPDHRIDVPPPSNFGRSSERRPDDSGTVNPFPVLSLPRYDLPPLPPETHQMGHLSPPTC